MHTVPHRAPLIRPNCAEHEANPTVASQREALRPTIFSEDPDAPRKLRERIASLEKDQSDMLMGSDALRKWDSKKLRDALILSRAEVTKLKKRDNSGFVQVPHWALTNNSANIRRLKKRLAIIERVRSAGTQERAYPNGVRLVDNAAAFKAQIFFPILPRAEFRALLMANGFRWSPASGAWQCHRSGYAFRRAREIIAAHSLLADPVSGAD